MKTIFLILTVAIVCTGCTEAGRGTDSSLGNEAAGESNQRKSDGKVERDAAFVYEVVQSNYAEIKLAGLGNQRLRKPEVKKMAQTMLTEHTAFLNDLKTLAQEKAISVPVEEAEEARRNLQDMAEESDKDFDRAWCAQMMNLHDKNIDKFEERLEDTEDAELKAYIEKTLPVLRKHYEALKAYDEKLKRSNA